MRGKVLGLIVHIVLMILLFLITGSIFLRFTGALIWLETFAFVGLFVLAAILLPGYVKNSRILAYFYIVSLINIISLSIITEGILFSGIIVAIAGLILASLGHKEQKEMDIEVQLPQEPFGYNIQNRTERQIQSEQTGVSELVRKQEQTKLTAKSIPKIEKKSTKSKPKFITTKTKKAHRKSVKKNKKQ